MFTGLIERTVKVIEFSQVDDAAINNLVLDYPNNELKLGDSVAINGCCLTACKINNNLVSFEVGFATIECTNFKFLKANDIVNIERAALLNSRLDGHMVSGHIDTTATVISVLKQEQGWHLAIKIPLQFAKYTINKGSITLNGVSLTIMSLEDYKDYTELSFMIIPTTVQKTNLKILEKNSILNIEVDLVGKYIARITNTTR